MKYKMVFISFLAILFVGCQGASRAQDSLATGMSVNAAVSQAFFVKSWTLNRALITESRQRWISEAEKQIATGNLSAEEAAKILVDLNNNIGLDEAITSENFAYLTYLLVPNERANQYFAQADIFMEARKPVWKHLFKASRQTGGEILEEIEAWQPL
ncbi:hypothetical protein LCGC14_2780370, partial [marine sediment metagenome]